MKRRAKAKQFMSLWKEGSGPHKSALKLASGQYEAYYKKAMDSLCLEVDMAESLDKYVQLFCNGMIDLIEIGIPKAFFSKHGLILSKLLRLGEDILEYGVRKSDLFYVGLFVEQKINSQWYEVNFYKFVKNLLYVIYEKGAALPENIKSKIENFIKLHNKSLYALYFSDNNGPSFKRTG